MDDFKSKTENKGITEAAFEKAAQRLGCDVAAIKAVAEVESRGDGFLKDGRPNILFERHIFSRLTSSQFDQSNPEVSGPAGGYEGGKAEYARLGEAMTLNEDAALMAASWGKFQIMGFNYSQCGFKDIKSFTQAMVESESKHLEVFVEFIRNSGLSEHLKNNDWSKFAFGYNGPGYKKNNYAAKLQQAYERLASETRFIIESVKDLQTALTFLGISPGPVDGDMGSRTRSAIKDFQRFACLPETGEFDSSIKSAVQAVYHTMRKFKEIRLV